MESLLQARHCAEHFTWISSFKPHNNSEMGPITHILPISQLRHREIDLPKVTAKEMVALGFESKWVWLQSLCS